MAVKPTYEELEQRVKGLESEAFERKRAEDALRESKENLDKAQKLAHIGNWSRDLILNRAQWSDEMYRILGLTPGDPAQPSLETFLARVHPEDREYVTSLFQEVAERRKSFDFEFRTVPIEGSERIIRNRGEVECDETGVAVRLFGFGQDITERKRAEEALRESEEKYRTVLESNPDPVIVYDMEGRVIYLNPAFTRVFGWSLEEQIGKKIDNFVPEENWPETRMMIKKVTVSGESFSGLETRRYTKEGNILDISISGSFYRDQEGNVAASVINLRDITAQKRVEEQLQQSQKMEAIGTLASGIAHDFNNILSTIVGYTDLARIRLQQGTDATINLKEVLKASNRARELVRQILAVSRHGEQERKPICLSLAVKEGLKLLRASLPTTIEIRQNIEASTETVEADPTQIYQVLMNLCTNAHHAMSETGGVMEVSLTSVNLDTKDLIGFPDLKPGSYLKLTVSDTGHGMDQDILERIFDPYFTTKEKGVGTGLGLSVANGIVKSHGGAIRVYSKPGKGSTFHIFLPEIKSEVESEAETTEVLPGGDERILFVDDEETLIEIGEEMLAELGYEVETRISSVEALETFRADPDKFDLVITDLTMPHMTGEKLTREIMKIRPDTPVILCTGFLGLITEEKAMEIGIKEFIIKPLVTIELAKAVRRVLDER